jgi:GNAT superfamily N-acetyltransferase
VTAPSRDGSPPDGVVGRPADPDAGGDGTVAVCRVLEGALLDVEYGVVEAAVATGDAFVAVRGGSVVGALVRTDPVATGTDGGAARPRVEAVAVRPAWRGRGVGRALVEAAVGPDGLVATFRPSVRGFYESLGFDVAAVDDDGDGDDARLRGRLSPSAD